jgi:hypothetical protein
VQHSKKFPVGSNHRARDKNRNLNIFSHLNRQKELTLSLARHSFCLSYRGGLRLSFEKSGPGARRGCALEMAAMPKVSFIAIYSRLILMGED